MVDDDSSQIEEYIAEHGVIKCPAAGSGPDARSIAEVEANDRKISRRMSRSARKGWVKRASREARKAGR